MNPSFRIAEKISAVYAIVHAPTGKLYVGSAVNLATRLQRHYRSLTISRHHSPLLQEAWDASSPDDFCALVLERCEPLDLLHAEQRWLNTLAAEFNVKRNPFAGSFFGRHHSPELRQRLSEQRRGRPAPWVRATNRLRIGHPVAIKDRDAWRAKLSASMLGRKFGPHAPERGAKIGEANRRAWADPEARRLRGLAISAGRVAAKAKRAAEVTNVS